MSSEFVSHFTRQTLQIPRRLSQWVALVTPVPLVVLDFINHRLVPQCQTAFALRVPFVVPASMSLARARRIVTPSARRARRVGSINMNHRLVNLAKTPCAMLVTLVLLASLLQPHALARRTQSVNHAVHVEPELINPVLAQHLVTPNARLVRHVQLART
jgi:hypothetical protein